MGAEASRWTLRTQAPHPPQGQCKTRRGLAVASRRADSYANLYIQRSGPTIICPVAVRSTQTYLPVAVSSILHSTQCTAINAQLTPVTAAARIAVARLPRNGGVCLGKILVHLPAYPRIHIHNPTYLRDSPATGHYWNPQRSTSASPPSSAQHLHWDACRLEHAAVFSLIGRPWARSLSRSLAASSCLTLPAPAARWCLAASQRAVPQPHAHTRPARTGRRSTSKLLHTSLPAKRS